MSERAAYQLIGFGLALVGVGLLNLGARAVDSARFHGMVARAARTAPERFAALRDELQAEEFANDDAS